MQLADIDVRALRVNYVGELGWELHVPVGQHLALYDALMDAGAYVGIRDFGMYAMESMRLEKSYRGWKTELDHEYSPLRSGLHRFVDLEKPAFIGRDALMAETINAPIDTFVTLEISEEHADTIVSNTDALYGCPIMIDEDIVGYTTSGGYGHRTEKSLALGYLRCDLVVEGAAVMVNVLGNKRHAVVIAESPYDPQNVLLRS